ncbi:hypothetical protein OROHE_004262 [Orobanche hederae]
MARILFFKIRPSQEILKIRDGTHLEAEEILTYIKKPSKRSVCYLYSKFDVPSNVVQKKRVARILFFKIRPSQEILKIRDGIPLEAEEILTYIKSPRNGSVFCFSSKLDVPSNVVQNKKVAQILFLKIRPSQEILKIRDGTLLEAEEILTYIKKPSKRIYVPSNVVQKKRVAQILFFKIRPSQEILKIRDGIPLEAEEILTYIKSPRNGSVCHFSSKLDVPSNVVQNKKVARILLFKIRPSQEILKIRDGTPLEAEEILTYIKKPSKRICLPSQEILKIRDGIPLETRNSDIHKKPSKWIVARILLFKIRPSQEILKIRDGTPLEKRVARILFFKIRPSQEILKIRDGTPLEAEEILTYIKKPSKRSVCYLYSKFDVPSNVVQKKRVARILFFKIRPSQEILKIRDVARILLFKIRPSQEILKIRDDVPSKVVQKKRVARILFFKIRPSQEILKIRDGIPLEAEEILTYIKSPRNGSVCYFSSKLDVPSNVVQKKKVARILLFKIRPSQKILKIRDGTPLEKKRVARILFFKIRPSQEILKIRDGTPLEAEEILTYIKKPSKRSVCYLYSKFDVPSNVVQKKRVARILFFKIRPSQEILKIRDGTPLEAEEILTYIKKPRNGPVCYFSSKLDVPSNVVQKKRVARILFFKIRPSQEILKIRDGTLLEAEEILTYIKKPSKRICSLLFLQFRCTYNVVQNKKVARILFFKIRPSQEILKIRDGIPLEAEEILTYIKSPRNGSVCCFSSKLDVPSNVVQNKKVAQILFLKIRPSQEILKIRDGTLLEAEEILTYIKKPSKRIYMPSQEILKIRDGTPLEAEEILTYIKKPSKRSVCYLYSKFDVPSNVVQKKRVARILFFKIRPSQEILKIRDGTPLEAEEILTCIKKPRNGPVCYFSSKLDVPSNVVQKKRVARILFFKIRPSQEILKIRDGTPLEEEEILTYIKKPSKRICLVARILFFKIRPSQEILKIRDGTPLEAEEILTYIKSPRNVSICYFSSKLDVPSNVVQKKKVARILFFKIRPSQEILKIPDGTPLEAEEILTYIKKSSKWIEPSQEILKIRDGTPLEAEEILTYIKKPSKRSVCYLYSKFDVPSNVVQKKRVARILFFKIRPSQEILKIRDGTPLEAEEILTCIKKPRNGPICYFSSKLDVPSNVVQKKRVARILFFKIRPSQEILKIRDGTPLEEEEILTYIKKPSKRICLVARILFFKIRPSQEILKIRDGTPLEAEEILTYIKSPRNVSICYFSSKLDVPSNVVQKKKVARILFFKIRPSQEILKIPDGTPLEAEEILTYIKKSSKWIDNLDVPSNVVQKKRVARILFFKIRPSQEILKIRDGIPLEAEEILTYIKSPRNGSVCYFSSKLDVPSNVVQKKKVARILLFKIRPSQEILKIRDGTPLEKKRVARILFFKIRPSQEILKIRDGTPLEAEEILTYIKKPSKRSVCYLYSKFDVPSNVVQKKRVARILFFKIRPSQEILKIRDGIPLEAEEILTYIKSPRNGSKKRVARILFFKIRPSQEILKIRDGTPLEAEEILTCIKKPSKRSVCYLYSKFDVPSNVVQKKRVARILFFKIRPSQEILKIRDGTPLEEEEILTYIKKPSKRICLPSQEILKIRDGTPLEAEEILTYIKSPRNVSICYFSSKLDVPSNVVQKKKVARILFFKIRPSQEILKIPDGTPLEAEEILTYIKNVQKKRVARILFFKIRPSQEILKIRDGTPLEVEEILTCIKKPRNGPVCYFSSKLDVPSNVVQKKRVARILFFKIRPSQEILKIRDGTPLEEEEILTYIKKPSKRICLVARILFFKIRPSQEILKIRDGTPLEAEEILTYIKSPRNVSICYFSSKLDVPSNVVQKKKVARILFFKIRPSQEILKIRDGTPLEAEEILTYIKKPSKRSVCYLYSKFDVPSNVVQKKRVARILFFKIRPSQEILKIRDGTPLEKRVARILFFKIRPSQEILKIRDGTPLEAEEILTYIKKPSKRSVCYLYSKFDVPSNVVQKKRVARILFFKIRPSQEILKIRDGIPLEAEEILTYIKSPRNGSVCYFSSKLDVPSNVVQKKKVARILLFKIRPSQEILKIRDGTPLEAEEILTYIKKPSKRIYVPSNVVQKKRVARILFFKIRPSQEILKIRDGTPLEAEEILTYIKSPRNVSICYFSSKLDVPSNVVQKKKVARILFFKIRPSQEILKIPDGTPLEAEEILTYIKKSSKWIDVPSNVVQKKRVARILFFKIRPSQEILKIRDGIPLEAEEILTYIKSPRNGSVCYFSSKLDVPSNVVQKKKVARILLFKIRPSQEILKIRDGTPLEKKRVARILFFKIRPSQEILKIRDGTPLEAEEILTYIKKPSKRSVCYLYSKFDVPSNVVQKKRVARILFFKIRPSQEILKIRDGIPLEAEEILTYIKSPRNGSKKRVARILFFKIRPSQEILKIRDGTPLEAEEILTCIKKPSKRSVCYLYSKFDVPSNVVQKKRVARILFFKIRPSQEILKIRDGTPLEEEEILTYIKKPSKRIWARILFFKIRPSQEILKIRDGTPLEAEEILTYIKSPRNVSICYFSSKLDVPSNVVQKKKVARILFFKIRPSQEILKIPDGTPLEAEEILTYIKIPRNGSVCYFSSKLDVPSNVVQKKKVARILFFKIRPSQEILKIPDGTPLEAEEILTYIKKSSKWIDVPSNVVQKKRVARILFFKIRPSQEILKIRDGTPLEAEEILTYIKSPRNVSICYFSSKLDVPSNVVQKKKVARILFFKIRPSQEILKIRDEILKIRDGTPLVQKKRVARILFFKIRPSQEILKIRDGTPLEAEEILTCIKKPRNGPVCYFSSKLDVPSNVVQKKRVARILFFKIRPSQEILKIRDGTPLEEEEILTYIKKPSKRILARILFFKIRPSQEILKIRDGTPLEAEEILTYIKSPRNVSICYFSSKLDVPSNVVQKKKVARILFFKIRPSQEILKIRDGTPLEAEEILTYIKKPSKRSVCYLYSKFDVPSNVVQKKRVARILFFKIRPSQEILKIRDGTPLEKKRVARILFFKIRPSQEILKIRDGTPLEAEEILTYIKKPSKRSVCYLYSKFDVPSNVVQKKRVARILFFKIRPSQEILKIRDGIPLEAEEILTYIKSPRNGSVCYFSSKLDVPSNVVQKKKVARILLFKIRPSQEILKIRDGTPLEAEEILTYIKKPSKRIYVPSNVVQKKRVARILFFKIRPSQEILKIRDGIPLEAEEILTYIKSPRNGSVCYFSSKLDVPSNVVQKKKVARILLFKIRPSQEILKIRDGTPLEKKRVARILFFKIRPSQEILKIRDGTPLEAEEILTYIKKPSKRSVCYLYSKFDVPSNVVQKKRVARILFFKIRPSQEILKIPDGTPLEAEEILTYIKKPRNGSVCYFSSKLDIPSNVVQKKKVARILLFKIRPSQEILKIRDGTPLEKKRVARILFFKIRPSQEILKIRDGTPLEAEEILTYIKKPSKRSVCYLYSKFDVPSNVVQKKRVARILFFKIRPSQEILKIPDGTPLEAEEILTYIKKPRNGSVCYFSSKLDIPSNVVQKKKVARILLFKIRPSQEILKIRDGTPLEAEEILTYIKKPSKRILARILFFKIRPSQEILKIRDGTPLEAEEILTYIKKLSKRSVCYLYSKFDVPSNVVQKKRVARILFFKIRPSQEILKIRDGTLLEAEEILTYIKKPSKRICSLLFLQFRCTYKPSQEILKIRDGTPLEAEEILTYIKKPSKRSVCCFSSKFDVPSNVVQKKRVARILFLKIRPSQEILKIRDGTLLEAEEILTYIKKPSKRISKILKIRDGTPLEMPSQEILKIRDGTPLEAEEILTYIKKPSKRSVCYLYSKFDVPSNVVQKKRVARILFFKIRPSQEILKIRDGTPLEAEEILTCIKKPRNGPVCYFSSKLDVPSNVVQKKRVARILFFKIRPSQEILKIRDGTPLEEEEILTYIKKPSKRICLLLFQQFRCTYLAEHVRPITKATVGRTQSADRTDKGRPHTIGRSQDTVARQVWADSAFRPVPDEGHTVGLGWQHIPASAEGQRPILLGSLGTTSAENDEVRNNLRSQGSTVGTSRTVLTTRGPLSAPAGQSLGHERPGRSVGPGGTVKATGGNLAGQLSVHRPSQEILKIRDGTPLEAEEILTYIKKPSKRSVCYLYSKFDVPSNVVQKKRVARILFFKIRPSQEILKIRDGTPLEAEEILTCIKKPRNGPVCYFSSKLDVPSNVVQKKRVARILFFKIRPSQEILKIRDGTPLEEEEILTYIKKPSKRICLPSQEILKIRDGTPLEAEEILTYIKKPSKRSVCYLYSKFDVPSNVVQKKRVARILFFKIRPSQEILKIRDGTPLEAEEILTYIKKPRNGPVCYFSSKLDVPSNVVQKKRVARILFFKIRPSQEILKIRDGTPLEKRVARILFSKIRPSQEILKIRYGTPLEAEEILTYIKKPSKRSVCYLYSKFDVPSNVVQKKRVARILFFKIRPSQEILKIRDGTPLEAEEILTCIKKPRNGSVLSRILFFKIRPSQEILKIRDGTPLEAEEILTYIKKPSKRSVCYLYSKFDVPSNVVQKKRVARILFFKIRPSQEILKIRDGTPLEAEEILTCIKKPRNGPVCYFSSKLDVPSNVVQKKRVARILFFKIRPSQEILKIRDGTPLEEEEILTYIKKPSKRICLPSQEILKIRDGTPLEAEEILTYIKKPSKRSVCYLYSKFDVPSNVVQKKRVARILFFKIRPSQEILKIRDGTPLEAEEILTYIKKPRNGPVCYFSSKLDVPSNVVQKKRVARILFFKIRPSQEILKIRDGTPLEKKRVARILFSKIRPSQEILKIRYGTPLEAEEILTYIKKPSKRSVCYLYSKFDVPSNVVQKKRVARILFFKIRPSQEILKIRDGTPLEAEEILTCIKKPRNGPVCYFSSKLDVPSNVVQKKIVARILFFKIRPSQEILKIRDGTPLEEEEILTYIKKPSKRICLPSQEILKIRDGTPLEAEEILTYIKKPSKRSVCYLYSKFDVPSNVVQKKRVARILFFKIRPSQEILKIRDGTPLEAEEILTYIKKPRNGPVCYFSSKLDVPSNVVQKKRVARILFFKIRPSQEILKIRDGTPLEKKRVARILFSKIRPSQEILKIRYGTPLEAEEILTYIKKPSKRSVCYLYSKFDVPSNVVQKKRVARILFFKIRPSQEILKIRDGTPLEAEEILTCIKKPRNGPVCYFSSKLDVPSNVVQKKIVARILFFKIRPSQEILKIRDGTPLEEEEILTYIKKPSKRICLLLFQQFRCT